MSPVIIECPYCHHQSHSEKKEFSVKELLSPHNAHMIHQLGELKESNPVASGVIGTLYALNKLGVIELHFCRNCHLPFL